jgi:hypothetical protein
MSAAFADWNQTTDTTMNDATTKEPSQPTRSRTQTSTGFRPDFDIDNRRGAIGEHLVGTFLEAIGTATVEVKTDSGAQRTGNFYIETCQRPRDAEEGVWVASGVNRSTAEWWAFAGPGANGFIAVRADVVKALAADAPETTQPIHNERTNASKGRLVKVKDIVAAIVADS